MEINFTFLFVGLTLLVFFLLLIIILAGVVSSRQSLEDVNVKLESLDRNQCKHDFLVNHLISKAKQEEEE